MCNPVLQFLWTAGAEGIPFASAEKLVRASRRLSRILREEADAVVYGGAVTCGACDLQIWPARRFRHDPEGAWVCPRCAVERAIFAACPEGWRVWIHSNPGRPLLLERKGSGNWLVVPPGRDFKGPLWDFTCPTPRPGEPIVLEAEREETMCGACPHRR